MNFISQLFYAVSREVAFCQLFYTNICCYGDDAVCLTAGLNAKGNTVGAEARFTVETFSAGRGDLDITVINPDGQHEKVGNSTAVAY